MSLHVTDGVKCVPKDGCWMNRVTRWGGFVYLQRYIANLSIAMLDESMEPHCVRYLSDVSTWAMLFLPFDIQRKVL